MNRDAKIGIVVILIIVGLLVIIWGRSERSNEELLAGDPTTGKTPTGLSPNSLGPSSGRGEEALPKEARAVSPEGIRVVSPAQLPLPPAHSIPGPDGKKPADVGTVVKGQEVGLGTMDYRSLSLKEIAVS